MSKSLRLRLWIVPFIAVCLSSFSAAQTTARQRGVKDIPPTSASPSPVGPYYALVIGNNNYQYVNKLQTAVNDARAVAQLLRGRYGFQTKELYDANRAQILTALDDYRRDLPEQSNLLIYYAGHGHKDVDAHRAYWLPVDADKDHTANWINAAEITDALRAIRSRHVLIISDSCWSGDLTMRITGAGIMPGEHNALLVKMLSLKSRHIMASGGDEPVADAGASGHSVFAGALLQSLNDMEDDTFTAEALLSQRVKPRVAGRSAQTPQYDIIRDSDADLGDFVFFRSEGTLSERSHDLPVEISSGIATGGQPTISNGEMEKRKAERDKALAENALIAQVNPALQSKSWAAAEPILQQLIAVNPNRWEYLQALGNAQLSLAKYTESVASFERAIPMAANATKTDPKADPAKTKAAMGQMLSNEGSAYTKLKQNDKAIAAYTKAAEIDPNPGTAFFNLCATQYNTGNIEGALAACDKAIAANPNKADAYFIKGSLLIASSPMDKDGKVKSVPGTEQALNKYLELAPDGPHASDVKELLAYIRSIQSNYKQPKKK